MTSVAEFMETQSPTLEPARIALRMTDGSKALIRAIQRLTGAALAIAAIGLWLAPGSSMESDVLLFKLILSVVAVIAGLGLMQSSSLPTKPNFEIDTIRRELRIKHPAKDGAEAVVEHHAFGDLARAEQLGSHIRLWGQGMTLLAEVTMNDRKALNSLVAGLRDAGKLA